MTAYYNENDPKAAAWLRELIREGLIAKGEVDERDIRDIRPADLAGFVQCHFFAGIGGWSHALRLAGWPDDKPVWTGSCPCQPFSAAGKGEGFADERHLWPYWFWLIEQCQPRIIFGEQVASKPALAWLDLVSSDLEATGYAVGAVDIPACGVGAPHIRNRLWWVAESNSEPRRQGRSLNGGWNTRSAAEARPGLSGSELSGELADGDGSRCGTGRASEASDERDAPRVELAGLCDAGELGHAERARGGRDPGAIPGAQGETERGVRRVVDESQFAGATGGFWSDADWLPCRDGKARPVEPGAFPLAHGIPARVGRLRGYGNAIVPAVAAEFIKAYLV